MFRTPPRRTRAARAVTGAALGLAAVGSVALGVAPAHAAITVTPSTALPATGTSTVSVTGTIPVWASSANRVAITTCNVDPGVTPGARCDAGNASPFLTPVAGAYAWSLTVQKTFDDYDYTGAAGPVDAGTTTTCKGTSGSVCHVVASYYAQSGSTVTQVGAESFAITFN